MVRTIELMDRSSLLDILYEQLVLDPARTAVVAVDLTRRLLDPTTSPLPPADRGRVIANNRRFLALARERGFPVIHVVTAHRPVERNLLRWPAEVAAAGLSVSPYDPVDLSLPDYVEGRWNADILPEVGVAASDYVIRNKKTYSAFHGTDLRYLLNAIGATRIILVGLNSNTSLQATLSDALDGYGIGALMVPECTASIYGTDLHELAVEHFGRCIGWNLSIEQLVAKLDHPEGKRAELPRIGPFGHRSVELLDRSDFVQAMKARLTIDPARTAVIQIDMHRRQADPRWAPLPPEIGEPVIERTGRFLDRCRSNGIPVIQIMVNRRPVEDVKGETSRFSLSATHGEHRSPYGPDLPYDCGAKEGEFTWDIMPQLGPAPTDYLINSKKSGSCFHHTDLESLLRALEVETLVVTGINTNTCDTKCMFDAANRGLRPIIISDCVDSTYGPDMHLWALENLARSVGWVLTADEFEQKVQRSLAARRAPASV